MVNNDLFVEQLVKRTVTSKESVGKVLTILLAVLAILFVNIVPLFFGIVYLFVLTGVLSFGIGFLAYRSVTGLNKEYEYSVVNDTFAVDIIKAKTRRSSLFSGSIRDFEMAAKCKDDRHPLSEFDKPEYLRASCVSGECPDDEWYIATKMGEHKVLLIIEPNEKVLKAFFRFNPRNVMYRPAGNMTKKEK